MKRRPPTTDHVRDRGRRRRRVALILASVGLACGAASLYLDHVVERRGAQKLASGTVSRARAHKTNGLWHLELEYSYRVQGRRYVGRESRLLRQSFKNETAALAKNPEAKVGRHVTLSYDPEEPARATLAGATSGFGFFAKASVLWLALALAWFVYDRAETRHRD